MKQRIFMRSVVGSFSSSILLISIVSLNTVKADLTQTILTGIEDGIRINTKVQVPLSEVKVPEPSNLYTFIKNKPATIKLGKALFWDMQVGSDGIQACASCHFSGGADNRVKNQLGLGLLQKNQDVSANPDTLFDLGREVNNFLAKGDFPHHQLSNTSLFSQANLTDNNNVTTTFETTILQDSNDIVSSQGVHFSQFIDAISGQDKDKKNIVTDPHGFQALDNNAVLTNTRQVQARNTPTNINSIFNDRNFWDGRAQRIFNGVNTLGDRDPSAFVFKFQEGILSATKVSIDHASVASQAMGPPLSNSEMSADGRSWANIGKKFVGKNYTSSSGRFDNTTSQKLLRPLGKQLVAPSDSVLGELSAYPHKGLDTDYEQMIRQAFKDEWWRSDEAIRVNADGSRDIVQGLIGENIYSQMEMNFSLFFGLAVQLYQATLVADQTPFDQWLAGDESALTESEKVGFFIAHDEGRCLNCHGGPELTFASVSKIEGIQLKDGTLLTEPQGLTRVRRNNLIDEGFNNIGVRPTLEDLGVGGELGNGLGAISIARLKHLDEITTDSVTGIPVSLKEKSKALGADGAFKIPGLRNIALTAPYFHNGGESSLEDVVDFYLRGGNFRKYRPTQLTDCASDIPAKQARLIDHPVQGFNADRTEEVEITGLGILKGPLANSGPGASTHPVGDCIANDGFSDGETNPNDGLDEIDRDNLVAWLKSLTDERVRRRSAPFDHPQLFIPNGHLQENGLVSNNNGVAADQLFEIPAVGATGGEPLPLFEAQLVVDR